MKSNSNSIQASVSPQNTGAKHHTKDGENRFYLSTGVVYQSITMFEIGVMYGVITAGPVLIHGGKNHHIHYGIKFSTEASYINSRILLGPKLSIESNFYKVFGGRVNLIHYTNFTDTDNCVSPEIGISFGGYFTFFYGYNIHLSKNRINEISNHRLSITLNL